jgi:hypothetical protein
LEFGFWIGRRFVFRSHPKFQNLKSKIKNGGSNLNGLRKKKAQPENQDTQEKKTQKKNEIY